MVAFTLSVFLYKNEPLLNSFDSIIISVLLPLLIVFILRVPCGLIVMDILSLNITLFTLIVLESGMVTLASITTSSFSAGNPKRHLSLSVHCPSM